VQLYPTTDVNQGPNKCSSDHCISLTIVHCITEASWNTGVFP